MHTLIYALVEAQDSNEAVSIASESVFDALVGATPNSSVVSFDYYTTFADGENSSVSGEGRYGPKPEAALVTSEAGAEMLWLAWNFTRSDKHKYLDRIREGLNNWSNDEIMAGWKSDAEVRPFDFDQVGEDAGSTVRLYDDTGWTFGITKRTDVEKILEECVGDIDVEPYETLDFDDKAHVETLIDDFYAEIVEYGTNQATLSADGDTVPDTNDESLWIVPADVHF